MIPADLATLYADPFLTVPCTVGGVSTRGYLDDGVAVMQDDAGAVAQVRTITLRVRAAAVPAASVETTVRVGDVGAAVLTASARAYRVRAVSPVGDGLEVDLVLARAS